jgi:hypothetical protein
MPDDPVTRLQFARDEIDRVFGAGYAASRLGVAIEGVAAALLADADPLLPQSAPGARPSILRAR